MTQRSKKRGKALVLAFGLSVGAAPESAPEQYGKLNCPTPDWCDLKLPRPIDKPDESIPEQTIFAQTPPETQPPHSGWVSQQPEQRMDAANRSFVLSSPPALLDS